MPPFDMVHGFKTIEEAFEHVRKVNLYNDLMTKDWQRDVKPGDFVVRRFSPYPGEVCTLYYEILDPKAPEYYDPDDSEIAPSHRFVQGYSKIEPGGELGVEHISSFDARIDKTSFQAARMAKWPNLFDR